MTTDFQKMRLSLEYDNYEQGLGAPEVFEICADYCQRHGALPEEVLYVRPGLWVAGPNRGPRLARIGARGGNGNVEPAAVRSRQPAVKAEAGAVEGQPRLL